MLSTGVQGRHLPPRTILTAWCEGWYQCPSTSTPGPFCSSWIIGSSQQYLTTPGAEFVAFATTWTGAGFDVPLLHAQMLSNDNANV